MKLQQFACFIIIAISIFSCQPGTTGEEPTSRAVDTTAAAGTKATSSQPVDPDTTDTIPADGYDASSSNMQVAAIIRQTLTDDILKNDLSIIPPEQRKFKYQAFDLNNDGKDEYLVTIPGSYFCGSGGCSAYLLDNDGKLINNFSVMSFPVYVAASTTEGWQDLIVNSRGKFYYVKMKNGKYPMNPTVQPLYKGDPPNMAPQLLDIYKSPYPAFNF